MPNTLLDIWTPSLAVWRIMRQWKFCGSSWLKAGWGASSMGELGGTGRARYIDTHSHRCPRWLFTLGHVKTWQQCRRTDLELWFMFKKRYRSCFPWQEHEWNAHVGEQAALVMLKKVRKLVSRLRYDATCKGSKPKKLPFRYRDPKLMKRTSLHTY